jgi:hypothetical protein
MAVPTGTVQTFAMVGIREQLSDTIANIDPMDTPFYSRIKKGTCKTRTPEWIIDTHRAANADNAVVEGTDATNLTPTTAVRLKNVVQLFEGTVQVSSTSEAVDAAGRSSEMAYQIAKEGKAIRTDIEARICGNKASVLGDDSTAGAMAGYEAWITTCDSRAGTQGGFNTGTGLVAAASDGTQRAFTETIFKATIKTCWENGAKAPMVMVGPFNKQVMSSFSGIAQATNEVKGSDMVTIVGAADVYVSDFGRHMIVPNRFSRDRSALLADPSYWELLMLQPFKTEPLAKTGHSIRRMISCEATLKSRNEQSSGIVADLTTS